MSDFIIKATNKDGYDRFLLWLSSESLLDHMDCIEESQDIINVSGKILIDQLLLTGNEYNRFITFNLVNGKLDFRTAKIVTPPYSYRIETINLLRENYCYVENSILTAEQRRKVRDGVAF